jgi:hypothetical protein
MERASWQSHRTQLVCILDVRPWKGLLRMADGGRMGFGRVAPWLWRWRASRRNNRTPQYGHRGIPAVLHACCGCLQQAEELARSLSLVQHLQWQPEWQWGSVVAWGSTAETAGFVRGQPPKSAVPCPVYRTSCPIYRTTPGGRLTAPRALVAVGAVFLRYKHPIEALQRARSCIYTAGPI